MTKHFGDFDEYRWLDDVPDDVRQAYIDSLVKMMKDVRCPGCGGFHLSGPPTFDCLRAEEFKEKEGAV
jgi:pyoverdine/dityrosine biosynthesis protein Dit1